MTTIFTTITLAGLELEAAYDKSAKEYYILVPSVEKALSWRADSTREKIASKSLKTALGKEIRLGKKLDTTSSNRRFVTTLTAKQFVQLIGWSAKNGFKPALDIIVVLANEAIERRIDVALNQSRPEQSYEDATREFFSELSRRKFMPEFTSWLCDSPYAVNYGKEVNIFKSIIGVPQQPKEGYSMEDMEKWCSGITSYNTLRMEGYSHERTYSRLKACRLAKEE